MTRLEELTRKRDALNAEIKIEEQFLSKEYEELKCLPVFYFYGICERTNTVHLHRLDVRYATPRFEVTADVFVYYEAKENSSSYLYNGQDKLTFTKVKELWTTSFDAYGRVILHNTIDAAKSFMEKVLQAKLEKAKEAVSIIEKQISVLL